MRETQPSYVADSPLQFALRETRKGFRSLQQWAVLLALIVVLTVSGPFGTLDTLALPQRLGFWAVMVVLGFAVGDFTASNCRVALIKRGCPQPFRVVITGVAAGVAVLPVALSVEWFAFGSDIFDLAFILKNSGYTVLMGIIVAGIVTILLNKKATAGTASRAEDGKCRLLERLAFAKRGDLISLSVADHYVEVTTTKGTQLLLMRLSDAISECAPTAGLQIHRSHWVALVAIKAVERRNGKVMIETVTGQHLPVSRSFLPKVREAGLLA
ncbi:LytTR family DNA-binding domain-containing protein [Rhizobium sp. L1K21]|uniref:LytTR family DNA-binding domain-containing protein n=1 Tax=Rhizobium sp. L1K21 TaxID=2954933 RepID=UPI002092863D|nr:LytTR family DNA-binding domain-containing protein [Rhizobium sp. L1K21]MCO6188068.1 LytTR family transcriptional regulator [Rhizobium sp. L1K21]